MSPSVDDISGVMPDRLVRRQERNEIVHPLERQKKHPSRECHEPRDLLNRISTVGVITPLLLYVRMRCPYRLDGLKGFIVDKILNDGKDSGVVALLVPYIPPQQKKTLP